MVPSFEDPERLVARERRRTAPRRQLYCVHFADADILDVEFEFVNILAVGQQRRAVEVGANRHLDASIVGGADGFEAAFEHWLRLVEDELRDVVACLAERRPVGDEPVGDAQRWDQRRVRGTGQ